MSSTITHLKIVPEITESVWVEASEQRNQYEHGNALLLIACLQRGVARMQQCAQTKACQHPIHVLSMPVVGNLLVVFCRCNAAKSNSVSTCPPHFHKQIPLIQITLLMFHTH